MATPLSDEGRDLLFRTARSYNGYLDKPVTEAQLREIWDLLKMGPTSANLLPLRIVWCVSDESKEKLAALSSGTNAAKIRKAPVTAILAMDTAFYEHAARFFPVADVKPWFIGSDGAPNEAAISGAFRNSSMQGAYFLLAARAIGLDTGPMSGFDNAAVDEAFFAGTTYKSNFISTLGYGDPATIFERLPRPSFEEFTRIA